MPLPNWGLMPDPFPRDRCVKFPAAMGEESHTEISKLLTERERKRYKVHCNTVSK